MSTYSKQPTADLIQLLFQEEDRVTLDLIHAVAKRKDAVEPLREIIRKEYYWDKGDGGEFWITRHAVSILCVRRAKVAMPDLIQALEYAHVYNNMWLNCYMSGLLARFGPAIAPLLMDYAETLFGKEFDDCAYSFLRGEVTETLIRIALAHPEIKEKIITYLYDILLHPQETDEVFIQYMAEQFIYLDRKRGKRGARIAYKRGAFDPIDMSLTKYFKELEEGDTWQWEDLFKDHLDFYSEREILIRKKHWAEERAADPARFADRSLPGRLKFYGYCAPPGTVVENLPDGKVK